MSVQLRKRDYLAEAGPLKNADYRSDLMLALHTEIVLIKDHLLAEKGSENAELKSSLENVRKNLLRKATS